MICRVIKLFAKILLCVLFLGTHNIILAKQLNVNFVSSTDDPAVISSYEVLKSKFPTENLYFTNLNQNVISKDAGLYIVAGPQALKSILKSSINAPVLAIFISSISYQRILNEYNVKAENKLITAVFSDASVNHQIALAQAIFNKNPSIAIISSDNSQFIKKQIPAKLTESIVFIDHKPESNIVESLIPTQKANVLIGLPDPDIYNSETIKTILLWLYRRNQSLIGFSRNIVSAGGLATAYIELEAIQNETSKNLKHFLTNKKLPPAKYPEEFSIFVNKNVVKSFGLSLPDNNTLKEEVKLFLEDCCDQ